MRVLASIKETFAGPSAMRCGNIRDSAVCTLLLYTLLRSSEVLAGDPSPNSDTAFKWDHAVSPAAMSFTSLNPAPRLSAEQFSLAQPFSATEFRPRPRASVNSDLGLTTGLGGMDVQLRGNSLAQQMSEYRTEDRLRLLTLFEKRGSSLSLQAGKRGGPSLQWSSPWVSREGASHGLFDRWLSAPSRTSTAPRTGTARAAAPANSLKSMESGPPVGAK